MIRYLVPPLRAIVPSISWIAFFVAAVITLFAIYVGIALVATLIADDIDHARIRYRTLCELLKIFRRRQR